MRLARLDPSRARPPLTALSALLAVQLACGPASGRRPLAEVQRSSQALRERAMLQLRSLLVATRCPPSGPQPDEPCGLWADAQSEREQLLRCREDSGCEAEVLRERVVSLRERAESLGVQLDALAARCTKRCATLPLLELEMLRTASARAADEARAALDRADGEELIALRSGLHSTREFEQQRAERTRALEEQVALHVRALDAQQEAAARARPLCRQNQDCVLSRIPEGQAGSENAQLCEPLLGQQLGICTPAP